MTSTRDPGDIAAAIIAQAELIEAWRTGPGRDRVRGSASIQREVLEQPVRSGAMNGQQLKDYLITVVGLATDMDGLAPGLPGPELDKGASRIAVRALLNLLAAKAPGKSVEVRVPPYAAVQCVAGTTHTRGTPPSVVETDPVSWIRVATGRARWADLVASGRVAASGERCDLSRYLPVQKPPRIWRHVAKALRK